MTSSPPVRHPVSLRPRLHHPVLRRSAGALQFGLGSDGAVEVSGLDAGLRQVLLEWHGGQRVDDVVARAVELGAEAEVVRAVLSDLREAGALVDAADPDRVHAARAEATVLVSGGGPLVAAVAALMAAEGVGRVAVSAAGTVLAPDVGTFLAADRGYPRRTAAADAVRRVAPTVRCEARVPRDRVDLVVFTDLLHTDPVHQPAPVRGAPHLLARLADGRGLVGPLVLPGRSACLRCLDLHRAARDPCWPTVAADLAGRVGYAGPAAAAATAALAAEQALAALDALVGNAAAPPTMDGVLELDLGRGTLRRQHWPAHPDCACGASHAGPAASAGADGPQGPPAGGKGVCAG